MGKIYTKTGDGGETSTLGVGRVKKSDLHIQANGDIDELNSVLGVVSSFSRDKETQKIIFHIQKDLFLLGENISGRDNGEAIVYIKNRTLEFEEMIDNLDKNLPELINFILPGGVASASFLHLARSVCRRAERKVVQLGEHVKLEKEILIYLNRLSDLLFVLARSENQKERFPEKIWKK